MKKIKKSLWSAYWKLHDKKKMLVERLKGYLDGLPPKTRRRIVLAMLIAFAALASTPSVKPSMTSAGMTAAGWR